MKNPLDFDVLKKRDWVRWKIVNVFYNSKQT